MVSGCGRLVQSRGNYYQLWMFYGKEDKEGATPSARWMICREYDSQSDVLLYGSPLSASEVLYQSLWKNVYGAILTSATLTALGRL